MDHNENGYGYRGGFNMTTEQWEKMQKLALKHKCIRAGEPNVSELLRKIADGELNLSRPRGSVKREAQFKELTKDKDKLLKIIERLMEEI